MKKIFIIFLICLFSVPAFAVTSNVSVEGRIDVTGSAAVTNIFSSDYVTIGTTDATPAKLNVVGNAKLTGVVTAAAFYGTFEGTYTGEISRMAAFIFPISGLTFEAVIRMPHNATITSVEVWCKGGTSVRGRVLNAGSVVADVTANGSAGGQWTAAGSISNTAYTTNSNIAFELSAVTGSVNNATVQFKMKRSP